MDEQIDKKLEEYISEYVQDCMQASAFASLPADQQEEKKRQLTDHFNSLIFELLVNNISDDQVTEMSKIEDFTTPEALEKIQLMAAQIPGFLLLIDERFVKEAETIKQTGQIPQPPLEEESPQPIS